MQAELPPTPGNEPPPRANVLLVDDDPANLLALEAILDGQGHNLVRATSGEQALGLLLERDFAAVLLDVRMPGLDGYQTARLVRGRESSRHTPILFLTAQGDNALAVEEAYALGAVDYLVKPLVPVILRAKVAGFVELFRKTEQVKRQAELLRRVERQEFERNLRESEHRFAQFMQHLPGLAWIKDLQGRYVFANDAAVKAFRTPREQLYGKTDAEVFPEATAAQFAQNDRRALSGGAAVQAVETLEHEDGVLHHSVVNKFPIPGPDGEVSLVGGVAIDVTEQRRTRAVLEESELRFRQLAENIHEVFWMSDPQKSQILYVSPAYEQIWGRSCRSLYEEPRSFLDGIHPGDREHVRVQSLERQGRGEPGDVEYRVVRADGSVRWVRDRSFPVRDPSGRVYRVAGVAEDITEWRAARESLRASERRFKALASHAPVGIFQTDPEANCLFVNDRWCEMAGLSAAEAAGQGWAAALHPEDRGRVLCEWAAAAGREFASEYRYQTPQGKVTWLSGSAVALRDEAGAVSGYLGTVTDITDLKHAEEQLRQRAEENEKLMDLLPVGVFIAHDPACRRISGNRAGYELLRMPAGSNLSLASPPGEEPPFTALRNGRPLAPDDLPMQHAAARAVEVRGVEVEHVYPDGTTHTLYGSASPLFDTQGKVRGCVGSFLDITGRKRLEAELRQRLEQLAEADRRKDDFLAMLAHELRNPLAPMKNAVYVLRLLGPAEDNLRRAAEVIDRQVRHLTRLVDDLLDVSRITRGKIKLHRGALELAVVIARAVETSRPALDARKHRLTVTLPPEPVLVEGDVTRLSQVVTNLLNNAAKYTEEGGDIRLTVERIPPEVVVRVRDNGLGIPAELLPKVFDLFTQGDRSLARSEGGLGIGLTLVKTLTEMHGGTVEARSDGPGKGSEFVVRLPILERRQRAAGPSPEEGAVRIGSAPRRVLVVDDNEDAAESLAVALRVMGHEVRTAHDGLAALAAAEEFRPEVVVLDIGLPGMDGYEVARRIRRQADSGKVLLLAVTGYGQEEDRRRAEEAGFDAHLVKPADPTVLQRLLSGPRTPR